MEKEIYIQLLNEGTKVYRPVQGKEIESNRYEIKGNDIYNPDIEEWEFVPGSIVIVEQQMMEGDLVLVAVKEYVKD